MTDTETQTERKHTPLSKGCRTAKIKEEDRARLKQWLSTFPPKSMKHFQKTYADDDGRLAFTVCEIIRRLGEVDSEEDWHATARDCGGRDNILALAVIGMGKVLEEVYGLASNSHYDLLAVARDQRHILELIAQNHPEAVAYIDSAVMSRANAAIAKATPTT